MGGGRHSRIARAAAAGTALALLTALPAAARRATSVFRVGAVVAPSTQVSAQPVSRRSLRLSIAGNASPPVVQVGSGALRPLAAEDLRLPASGTVVVTLHY
ncbi:MAG TPA: hypothetical protein VFP52_09295 [Myxococcales bacterium]|nr:hypothetical protein [Myxococcales bacterium]HET9753147.1 hypothetical protein [Myxococcales bacterium]